MIRLLFGENNFLKRQKLAEILDGVQAERYDGTQLSAGQLQDILLAQTLFDTENATVIDDLSLSGDAWTALPSLVIPGDKTIIFNENKLDKRTKTYKFLQKQATTEEFILFKEYEVAKVVAWCLERAKKVHGFNLDVQVATKLVERLGVDMGRLDMVLGQLALSDDRSQEFLDALVPLPKTESAFELFAAAVNGEREEVSRIVAYLEADSGDDGAYQTMGLLASQLLQLNALVLSSGDSSAVVSDLGVNPYALRQLAPLAKKVHKKQLQQMNYTLGQADIQMKTTGVEPWLLVEVALMSLNPKSLATS